SQTSHCQPPNRTRGPIEGRSPIARGSWRWAPTLTRYQSPDWRQTFRPCYGWRRRLSATRLKGQRPRRYLEVPAFPHLASVALAFDPLARRDDYGSCFLGRLDKIQA